MGDSTEEYTIIEDESEPVRITPRCSVVKISCGFMPSKMEAPVTESKPTIRGDPYTSGRLDSAYANAMAMLDSLFDIDMDDPEQRDVAMRIRTEMAHYRILIDRYSDDHGDESS